MFLNYLAASICGADIEISASKNIAKNINVIEVSDAEFQNRIEKKMVKRIRFLSTPAFQLQKALAEAGCHYIIAPVLLNGRLELLNYLREVSISKDYHRYGRSMKYEGWSIEIL